MTLQLQTAATGIARSAHYVIPTGQTQPIQTLLLEPQRTNLFLQSEDASAWTNFNTCNVTTNAIAAPDGAVTGDLLTATVAGSARGQTCTFPAGADREVSISVYVKAGTSARSQFELRDSTAAVTRHIININWAAGIPTISTSSGAGTLYPVEAMGGGWYRIMISATGVVAANTNIVRVYPDVIAGTGSVYAWGAQAENAVVPSSYIKTEGTTITRNADSLYFPFTAPPQAMTIYCRGVHRGTRYAPSSFIMQISGNGSQNPRVQIARPVGTTPINFQTVSGAGTFSTIGPSGAEPILNDLMEFRGILLSNGNLGYGVTLNNGTESVSTPITGTALEAAWGGTRLYLNSTGGSGNEGLFAFTHLTIATGEQSRATMRQLAGVV